MRKICSIGSSYNYKHREVQLARTKKTLKSFQKSELTNCIYQITASTKTHRVKIMKSLLQRSVATLGTAAILSLNSFVPVANSAVTFDQVELNQDSVVAIAVPLKYGGYNLLVVEQQSSKRQCWSESDSNPVVVIDPLLLNFDFTGICGRATDSNGYSLRMANTDFGMQYTLSLQNTGSEVRLMATPRAANAKPIVIGGTKGITNGMMKIQLQPNWRFSKRAYAGKTLGHFYFTSNQLPDGLDNIANNPTNNTNNNTPPKPTSKFRDISTDVYSKEIDEAVASGFIAGYSEDSTFRPNQAVTREQLVSIVVESLKGVKGVNVNLSTQLGEDPYSDVEASRWSAAKIKFAKDNKIVNGYADGSFRPSQPVTRAELVAVLRRASEYGLSVQGKPAKILPNQTAKVFGDTKTHWGETTISDMSGYCGVASPLNEKGDNFFPDQVANRNYAAAATLRMLKCIKQ